MYRETVRGLRYFVKENGTRVVSDRPTNHAKAMAIGTTIDRGPEQPEGHDANRGHGKQHTFEGS